MNETERIGAYLSVRKFPPDPKRKTSRWTVLSNYGGELGTVGWFGRWRQYTFDPAVLTTFNAGCLRDIMTFLDRANREHAEQLKQQRINGDVA